MKITLSNYTISPVVEYQNPNEEIKFFFFSNRRRHTRCLSDWSSDVCSSDLTSLADQQDRLSIVIEYVIGQQGDLKSSDVYAAVVRNRAKLAYKSVGAWLANEGPLPAAAAAVPEMEEQLRIPDRAAQALDRLRHKQGAPGVESD